MSNKEHDILIDLFRHDVAACEAYTDVIAHLEDNEIKEKISSFKRDHERHVQELSDLIFTLFNEKPEEEKDLKGVLLTGYTALRSLTGQDGALKALQTAEHVVLSKYQQALKSDQLSTEAIELIRNNLLDENKHNQYVDSLVK